VPFLSLVPVDFPVALCSNRRHFRPKRLDLCRFLVLTLWGNSSEIPFLAWRQEFDRVCSFLFIFLSRQFPKDFRQLYSKDDKV